METQSLKFFLRDVSGRVSELHVDSELARVGSGAHCEVRLAKEQAAFEQLRIEVRSGAVFAEARSLSPATLLNGAPFTQGKLLPDSTLRIGDVELRVAVATSAGEQRKKPAHEQSRSKAIYALAAVGFPLGFWVLLTTEPAQQAELSQVSAPALFSGSDSACSESAEGPARAFAEQELARAESARERAPFDPEQGVDAVTAYARSAACFRMARETQRADQVASAAESLKRRLNQEFRIHQVRLEWAQATSHYQEARTEVRLLLSFVGRRGGEYKDFLSSLDRQIELKYLGKKE